MGAPSPMFDFHPGYASSSSRLRPSPPASRSSSTTGRRTGALAASRPDRCRDGSRTTTSEVKYASVLQAAINQKVKIDFGNNRAGERHSAAVNARTEELRAPLLRGRHHVSKSLPPAGPSLICHKSQPRSEFNLPWQQHPPPAAARDSKRSWACSSRM